jgi:hypothetical protein
MDHDDDDISDTLQANSDQLNADDLIGGPITVRIESTRRVQGESYKPGDQPLILNISGHRPYKPSKGMRRVLSTIWGSKRSAYVGRWLTLYRDPSVMFGSDPVGGIRISHASHIDGPKRIPLTVKKGKKVMHPVAVLVPPDAMNFETFKKWCDHALRTGWTREQVAELLGCKSADVPPEKRAELVERLKTPPAAAPPVTPEEAAADRQCEGMERGD